MAPVGFFSQNMRIFVARLAARVLMAGYSAMPYCAHWAQDGTLYNGTRRHIGIRMIDTDKYLCRALMGLLPKYGSTDIVVCPGTRNAPLVQAASVSPLVLHHVIDERVAAFVAVGMAAVDGRPVAAVCTSGSAVMDMAPACAEAYYRQIPLVVVSADRPRQWIGQGDGQTIRQAGALDAVVRGSWDIPVPHNQDEAYAAVRAFNDALRTALAEPCGPVHINIQIDAPIGSTIETVRREDIPFIEVCEDKDNGVSDAFAEEIARRLMAYRRILFLPGVMPPDLAVSQALAELSEYPQVVVSPEILSNVHVVGANIDVILNALTEEERRGLLPEVVVTVGSGITSALAKEWLRDGVRLGITRHWHIGPEEHAVDTFLGQTVAIPVAPRRILPALASHCRNYSDDTGYAALWHSYAEKAKAANKNFFAALPWCGLSAVRQVIKSLPEDWGLHLSNGTTVRYAQAAEYGHVSRVDANRGVNGIDGSTATAIGAAMVSPRPVLLITGDMSAQYDIGALMTEDVPARFKMVVINNSGGGIFRAIANTRHLPVMPQYLAGGVNLPLRELCRGLGFGYYRADCAETLKTAFDEMIHNENVPCVLEAVVPADVDADIFRQLYTLYKTRK